MYAGGYDVVGQRIEFPNPIAIVLLGEFGDVVKDGNLCESGGLCIIRVGGVDLEV